MYMKCISIYIYRTIYTCMATFYTYIYIYRGRERYTGMILNIVHIYTCILKKTVYV